MAFDQTTRNRLARFVSDARSLLTEEFTRQLQNEYGLDPASGDVTPIERLTALDDRQRETARILRETMNYYLAGNSKVDGKANRDVLDRIVREQAFTVLNRLCALRMSEARGLVLESIAKGYQSKGFQLYARLGGSALGETGETYQMYLFSLMDEFAVDLPVLFDRFSPQGRLFPREASLLKLLELINDPEIEPLWAEDETIGWIYQYFNSKEERKAMRDASQAPRNSRELAVRNQFFTPRYVVEFLTDNTLGRIWYEMTRGETVLKDSCRYLVRRKHSFFLEEGQEAPEPFLPEQRHETDPDLAHEMWLPPNDQITDLDTIFLYGLTAGGYDYAREQWGTECGDLANEKLKQYHESGKWEGTFDELRCCLFFEQRRYHHFGEEPEGDDAKAILDLYQAICEHWNYEVEFIPHRSLKDPREIKLLDPACGSMHFGLYAFDLFEQIYAEAWELEERLGEDALQRLADLDSLHKTYPDQKAYLKDVPRLIIEGNIHGVEIDPRAVQIAGLSLWLRAQKSWQAQGLHPTDRPQIRKSNVVCAEPMPGDRQMLEEFLATLRGDGLEALMRKAWHVPADQKVRATPQMADALAKLVRTVWNEMELAGEAGSLLKIEETLRDAIATARKESEEKSPLFQVLEYGLDEPMKEQYVQLVAGNDIDFFNRAEVLVLAALKDYAEQAVNGESYQRQLFAGDAIQGFDFINLCRKSYDVVLMNPPFGVFVRGVQSYSKKNYPETYNDVFAAFIDRYLDKLANTGKLGAITSRNGFFLGSFQRWRNEVLLKKGQLQVVADLGQDVMDDAMVEAAAYCLTKKEHASPENTYFIRLLGAQVREDALFREISYITHGQMSKNLFLKNVDEFKILRLTPFAYWVSDEIITSLAKVGTLDPDAAIVRCGLSTGNNDRFVRVLWEIPNGLLLKRWFPLVMTGTSQPWYSPLLVVVDWYKKGDYLSAFPGSTLRSTELYLRPGISWTRRAVRFIPYAIPSGCIPSASRYMAFPKRGHEYSILGIAGSNMAGSYLRFFGEKFSFPNYLVDSVKSLPWLDLDQKLSDQLEAFVKQQIKSRRDAYQNYEPFQEFLLPKMITMALGRQVHDLSFDYNHLLDEELDHLIAKAFGLSAKDLTELERDMLEAIAARNQSVIESEDDDQESDPLGEISENDEYHNLLSYVIGNILGRWDIRFATGEKPASELPDPFAPLPACPPGMLQNAQGLPATPQDVPTDYPLCISWGGVLVDDEGHSENLQARVREALHVIWREDGEAIESEACQILGVHSLREYFQKPTLFFAEHLKRYSKSRRAAPIYWPFSTPSGSYTLWLYYHRLNDQTLYTCVNDFVDPKLKQVSEEAARLRLKKGRSAAEEKELERLTDFERELKDFREELLRVAKFWKPNLNDGVEITAAPLWKLFQHKPWQKRLKETWQKLEAGEYDWAHLAYSIWPERVSEKCKADKSLAIAHDLEELYVEPPASAKKKKNKKPSVDEETEGWFNDD